MKNTLFIGLGFMGGALAYDSQFASQFAFRTLMDSKHEKGTEKPYRTLLGTIAKELYWPPLYWETNTKIVDLLGGIPWQERKATKVRNHLSAYLGTELLTDKGSPKDFFKELKAIVYQAKWNEWGKKKAEGKEEHPTAEAAAKDIIRLGFKKSLWPPLFPDLVEPRAEEIIINAYAHP